MGKRAREAEHNRDVTMAWTTAALHRAKKLPDLKTLMARREQKQTPKQMAAVLKQLSVVYKLKLRTKKLTHA